MHAADLNYLPENTGKVFEKLSKLSFISKFTLVGGTALSLQIRHRLSEDLDFIYDGQQINKTSIKRNVGKFFTDFRVIKEDESYQIDFIMDGTRVTFFSTGAVMIPFHIQPFAFKFERIYIAPPEIIGVLKLSAISQRNTFRDYYDLYMLAKHHFGLEKLIRMTKELNPGLSPITYSETLVYTDDIEEDSVANHLFPSEMVTKKDISVYFATELKKFITRM